jgi:predicted secreted protein
VKCSVCGVTDLRSDNKYDVCAVRPKCRSKRAALWRKNHDREVAEELAELRAIRDRIQEAINRG